MKNKNRLKQHSYNRGRLQQARGCWGEEGAGGAQVPFVKWNKDTLLIRETTRGEMLQRGSSPAFPRIGGRKIVGKLIGIAEGIYGSRLHFLAGPKRIASSRKRDLGGGGKQVVIGRRGRSLGEILTREK